MSSDIELPSLAPLGRPEQVLSDPEQEAEDKHAHGPDEHRSRSVSNAATRVLNPPSSNRPASDQSEVNFTRIGTKPFSDHVVTEANGLFLAAKEARNWEMGKEVAKWIVVGLVIAAIAIAILGLGLPAALVGVGALIFLAGGAGASYGIHQEAAEKDLDQEVFEKTWNKEFEALKAKYGDIPEMEAFWQIRPKVWQVWKSHLKSEDTLMQALEVIRTSSNPRGRQFARDMIERISEAREKKFKQVYNDKEVTPEEFKHISDQVAKNPELLEFMYMCEELEKDRLRAGSSDYKNYVDHLFDAEYTPTLSMTGHWGQAADYLKYNLYRRFDNKMAKDSAIHDIRLYRQFKAHQELRNALNAPDLTPEREAELHAKQQVLSEEEQTLLRSYGMIPNIP